MWLSRWGKSWKGLLLVIVIHISVNNLSMKINGFLTGWACKRGKKIMRFSHTEAGAGPELGYHVSR